MKHLILDSMRPIDVEQFHRAWPDMSYDLHIT